MISTSNTEKAKELIKRAKKPVIVKAQNDEFNRKMLEYGKFDILLSPEAGKRQRTLRQIDSGFNHILAKIAAKNKIAIGIDLEELRKLPKDEKALRLERIIQNIKLCRKTKTPLKLLNVRDKRDAFSLLASLGASSQQAKQAI